MKWRIIVRMSFTGNKGLQYDVAQRLERCGIRKRKTTGTWEGAAVNAEEAADEFKKVFEILAGLRSRTRGQLNHLWIYIDRAVEKRVTPTIPLVFKKETH
ncbi:MAG TPA: hypothetical protein VK557_08395 [Pyrinomonadaceae bacterium]|nr:hypothetical protein [Pyrinomonadaceae bacterium]